MPDNILAKITKLIEKNITDITDLYEIKVTTTGDETITGVKTFQDIRLLDGNKNTFIKGVQDTVQLNICAGTSVNTITSNINAPSLILSGINYPPTSTATNAGGFELVALNPSDATNTASLSGKYVKDKFILNWNNNNVVTEGYGTALYSHNSGTAHYAEGYIEGKAIDDALLSKLPLAGGTMLGNVYFSGTNGLLNTTSTSSIFIYGGTSETDGAVISLYGKNVVGTTDGNFFIEAINATNTAILQGTPDGSLTWNGKLVVTEKPIEGGTAQCALTSIDYTPDGGIATALDTKYDKVGGELTGNIWKYGTSDFSISHGGTVENASDYTKYPRIVFYNKDRKTDAGFVHLVAKDTYNESQFVIRPTGTITLKTIINGGTTTETVVTSQYKISNLNRNVSDSNITISGGTSSTDGANIILYGNSSGSNAGNFQLVARNADGSSKTLSGDVSDDLLWNGSKIVVEGAGATADVAKDYTSGGAIDIALKSKYAGTGGTLTGNIIFKNDTVNNGNSIRQTNNNNYITVCGGQLDGSTFTGAYIHLQGTNYGNNASGTGSFALQANDGSNSSHLIGRANGTLTWNNNEVLTVSNGLPRSGGEMTGKITGTITHAEVSDKLGTATIGSNTKPFYLNNGVATEFSSTIGSNDIPVYVNNGSLTSTGKKFSNYLLLAGGTMSGDLISRKTATGYSTNLISVEQINSSTGTHVASMMADQEGGTLRLSKANDTSHINIDLCDANGSNGYARLFIGNKSTDATHIFKFHETGAFEAEKVYGAVWNDYAEFFERGEDTEEGDIIALDITSEKEQYVKADENSKIIVGVHSNTYGHLIGGEKGKSIEENMEKFIPIGLTGRVDVKFVGKSELGEYVVPSSVKGAGRLFNPETDSERKIIGFIVHDDNPQSEELRKVRIMIKK